jgi:hypothetical protein
MANAPMAQRATSSTPHSATRHRGHCTRTKPHDIPVLIAAGLLKPLGGSCAAQMVKYFAAAELEKLHRNTQWLFRATDAVRRHWERKNARRSKRRNGRGGLHGQFEFTGTNSPITT